MTFEAFPKVPRLNRDCIITEKLDGTNAQVYIQTLGIHAGEVERFGSVLAWRPTYTEEGAYIGLQMMYAGSRNRFLEPGNDNFGFGAWVQENSESLWTLGEGRHFGEWWGQGIQRGYGLDHKRFSLFNVSRSPPPDCCSVVPVVYTGPFDTVYIQNELGYLREYGSAAAPGFMNPEGLMIYHTAARSMFKVTLENDEKPKGAP
jgi:hypothetical protein